MEQRKLEDAAQPGEVSPVLVAALGLRRRRVRKTSREVVQRELEHVRSGRL